MRVLLVIFSVNEHILHIGKTLRSLGCEVEIIYSDSYRQVCPYYMKKLDELGLHSARNKYLESVHDRLNKILHEFQPNIVLFINTPRNIFTVDDIKHINKFAKTICWFVDGITGRFELNEYIKSFKEIYVFEYQDVAYLSSLNKKGEYLPVGYNESFSNVKPEEKEFDILFIGSPFRNRLKILETIALHSLDKGWKLKIIGPFYDQKYPWKKFIFKRRYPAIYHYLENKRVSPEEAALLYSKTKICLNIHDEKHKSPNPRTFEIMASGSFELIDKREYLGGIISGKDLVEYVNVRDLISKINEYLGNNVKRNKIAFNGYKSVYDRISMKNSVKKILLGI